jgi:hypothetical protein
MTQRRILAGLAGGVIVASLALLSPAFGASTMTSSTRFPVSLGQRDGIGTFTPAATDARLAAALSRSGLSNSGFRFTPASSVRLNRSVTIAVRSRTNRPDQADLVKSATLPIAPIAYNLGAAVGWRKFAVTGGMQKIDLAGLGRRDTVDVGVSYTSKRLTTRVQLAADRTSGPAAREILGGSAVSVDLGSSYSLTRNLDVTAGVRYRGDRNRLLPQTDTLRDSQAVYVGTAFRF